MNDKKEQLREAAHHVFLDKGYKDTNISAIAKKAGIAVGSFYKYYKSKEEIFIDIYVRENDIIKNTIMDEINWDGKPETVIDSLFMNVFKYTSSNRILQEWNNPSISTVLHQYYYTNRNTELFSSNQFLSEAFRERLTEMQFDADLIEKLLKVYDLINCIDCHVSEEIFEGYGETLWLFVKYFIKGVFPEN